MDVRAARADDVPALAAGMKEVAAEDRWLATEPRADTKGLEAMFDESIASESINLVLEDGGMVVGAIGVFPGDLRGVWRLAMWIREPWRGRGGGRRLVQAALDDARKRPIHKIELEVFTDNAPALALYASVGFEVEGIRRDHYLRRDGSVRSTVLMARFQVVTPRRE